MQSLFCEAVAPVPANLYLTFLRVGDYMVVKGSFPGSRQ